MNAKVAEVLVRVIEAKNIRIYYQLSSPHCKKPVVAIVLPNDELDIASNNPNAKPVVQLSKSLQGWLRKIIGGVTGLEDLGDHDDFIELGMSPVQICKAVLQVNSTSIDVDDYSRAARITADDVKTNPTIVKLAKAIAKSIHSQAKPVPMDASRSLKERNQMRSLLTDYMRDMPKVTPKSQFSERRREKDSNCILLVGSTGSLGSYVLQSLLESSNVSFVYCLNRSHDALERQIKSHKEKGLMAAFPPCRVRFIHCSMSSPDFGLSHEVHGEMAQQVTHIIQNAWPVRWNIPLTGFKPSLQATRYLIDFSAMSPNRPSIMFTSSIAASLYGASPIPEQSHKSFAIAGDMGYSQSKNVAEHLLNEASKRCGVRHTICRISQLTGPILNKDNKGLWNASEWLPMLIASSRYMGKVPASLGGNETIDFLAVDVAAQVLVELLLREESDDPPGARVYNVVNPHLTTWHSLLPAILAYRYSDDEKPFEVVSLRNWVECLKSSTKCKQNPATFLMGFYQGMADGVGGTTPRFETTETVKRSATLAKTEAINKEWMSKWLNQWKFRAGWVKWEEEGLKGWKKTDFAASRL